MAAVSDVVQRTGENLGLVPIGQAMEAQDTTRITATYTETYAFLKQKGLANWVSGNSATIPDELVPPLSAFMAQKLAGLSYSVPEARYERIQLEAGPNGSIALTKIAEMCVDDFEDNSHEGDF